MPACSVIIPAYNSKPYIRTTVQSVLAQSMKDTEIIVIDDGSTDGTGEHLSPFLDRITLLRQDNKGPSAARNAGLKSANGEYVAFLDSDDLWLPDRLQKVLDAIAQGPFAWATTNMFLMYGTNTSNDTYYSPVPFGCRFRSEDQTFWISQYNFVFTGAVFPSSFLDRYGFLDESLDTCEDWDMWARFLQGGESIGLLEEPLGYYRLRPGSLAYGGDQMLRDGLKVLERARSRGSSTIPGIEGSVMMRKAFLSLVQKEWRQTLSLFQGAFQDTSISRGRRLHGALAGTVSRSAWRLYVSYRARRAT